MSKEILTKAIQIAIDRGWELPQEAYEYKVQGDRVIVFTSFSYEDDSPGYWRAATNEIIFNHGFAKALWGSWEHEEWEADKWQHHLQAMVLADDPIQYLAEHIPNKA